MGIKNLLFAEDLIRTFMKLERDKLDIFFSFNDIPYSVSTSSVSSINELKLTFPLFQDWFNLFNSVY